MDWITLTISLVDQILKKMPDYEQRKKEKYFKLKKEYVFEKNSSNRDDNRMCKLRDELRLFVESFSNEISK